MEQVAAKPAVLRPEADVGMSARRRGASPQGLSLPGLIAASVAVHMGIGAILAAIPIVSAVSCGLEETWVSFDLEPLPEPAAEPLPVVDVVPPPEPEVRRTRPEPREALVPQPQAIVTPEPVVTPVAPPPIDDVFAEESAPPADSLTADGPGAFAVAPGEPGGMPGGQPGGHGTSLTSSLHASSGPAPTGPSDADRRRARRSYVRSLEDLLRAHARYPRAAQRARLEGRVELALRIGSDGRLIATRVALGSGHDTLDQAALDAAHELSRVPPPPLLAALSDTDEVRVGVVYVVQ